MWPGGECGQSMASVLLRSQFSTDCHSGAALTDIEYEWAYLNFAFRKPEKFSGDYDCCCARQRGVGGRISHECDAPEGQALEDGVRSVLIRLEEAVKAGLEFGGTH